jgi:hypothetical protein
MRFRLTYAFSDELIHAVELETNGTDLLAAYETAIDYIEQQHGAEKVLDIVGISLLKIEGESHAN